MKKLLLRNQQLRLENQQVQTYFRNLMRQFGKISSNQNVSPTGAFPSDTEKNPIEQVQAINLRYERELEDLPSEKSVPKKKTGGYANKGGKKYK